MRNFKNKILDEFIKTQREVDDLPQFSAIEKIHFDNKISISHMYYSSKIEGVNLGNKRLKKVIIT